MKRARHLRRRRLSWPVRGGLVLLVALVLCAGAVAVQVMQLDRRIQVTVMVAGTPLLVKVAEPATVDDALAAAGFVPRPGRLLSLVTKKVLDPAISPVQLLVDGQPAAAGSPILAGATIGAVEPPDVFEGTVQGVDVVLPPPMPLVISSLWHPGQPGRSISRKGALSGEVVEQKQVQAPVPPARVTTKLVALTFDDGPWPTTGEILRILREKNVKATFCVVSRLLKKDGLETAKAALAEGHKMCNHTVNHDARLPGKSQEVVEDEIRGANRHLLERLGVKPAFYRPPAGKMGPKIEAAVKDEGQQVLLWSVDTKDFQKPAPEAIVGAVMANVQPGGIVLMHDGGGDRGTTLAALPALIDQLRAAGYEIVLADAVPPVPAAPVTEPALPA